MNFTLLQVYQGYPIKNNYLATWRHPHFLFLSFSTEPTKINGTHFHVLFIFTPSVSGEGKGRREGSREREGEIPEVGGAEEVVSIFRYAT